MRKFYIVYIMCVMWLSSINFANATPMNFFETAKNIYQINIKGIIHIGAYDGQEIEGYKALGATNFLWVEADPDTVKKLIATVKPDGVSCIVANFAASNKDGKEKFYIANNGQSSSLLKPEVHISLHPEVQFAGEKEVVTKTIDGYFSETKLDVNKYNVLVIDVQGAELMALQGAVNTLKTIDFIVSEVDFCELYKGGSYIWDLDRFLFEQGFVRVDATSATRGWGDALYVNKKYFAK